MPRPKKTFGTEPAAPATKTRKPGAALSGPQALNQAVWQICDVLRRAGVGSALRYVPELTWILFLRVLDEQEAIERDEAEASLTHLRWRSPGGGRTGLRPGPTNPMHPTLPPRATACRWAGSAASCRKANVATCLPSSTTSCCPGCATCVTCPPPRPSRR